VAFATSRSTHLYIVAGNSTSWSLDLSLLELEAGESSKIVAGDLILIQIGRDGASGTGAITGYTKLHETAVGTAAKGLTFVKVADAGDAALPTISFTPGASEQGVARVAVLKQWHGTISGGVEVSTRATGTTNVPNPPSYTASWGAADNYWRATFAHDNGLRSTTAYPANYTIAQSGDASGGGSGAGLGSAGRQTTGATEDAGTFTIDTADDWVAWVVVIRGGAEAYSHPATITGTGSVTAAGGRQSAGTAAIGGTGSVTATGTKFEPSAGLSHVSYYNGADVGATTNPSLAVTGVSWAPGDLILVYITWREFEAVVNTLTDDGPGETYTYLGGGQDVQNTIWAAVYTATASGTGSSATITLTTIEDNWAAGGGIQMEIEVVSGNAPAVDAWHQTNTGATDTDTPSDDITTVADATRRFFYVQSRNRVFTVDSGDSLTPIRENTQAGSSGGISSISSYYKDETSAGSKNASGTLTSALDWIATQVSVFEDSGTDKSGSAAIGGTGSLADTATTQRSGASASSGTGSVASVGGRQVSDAATSTGVGGIASGGAKNGQGDATSSGVGSGAATGEKGALGASTLGTSATIVATGEASFAGDAAIAGSGDMAGSGASGRSGDAAATGSGAAVADGPSARSGDAAVSATGALAATGSTVEAHSGPSAIAGTGSAVADGTSARAADAIATATGSTTAVGVSSRSDAAAVGATGSTTADGISGRADDAVLSGASSLTATGSQNEGYAHPATISSTGSLTAAGRKDVVGDPIVTAAGSTSASVLSARIGAAALAGAGSLAATGSTSEGASHPAAITAAGSIGATGRKDSGDAGALTAAATLVAAYQTGRLGSGALGASGGLVGDGTSGRSVAATISGTGALAATGEPPPSLVAPLRVRVGYAGNRATIAAKGGRARVSG